MEEKATDAPETKAPRGGYGLDSDEQKRVYESRPARKKRRKLRIALLALVALVVIVIAVVGGSYLWLVRDVHGANARLDPQAAKALSESPPSTLVPLGSSNSSKGKAEDIMLVGNDSRSAGVNAGGRSDTLMIVHVDEANNYVGVLSIPRDLYVDIAGHGKNKINAAYAFGGASLAIKTVKQVTGVNITKYGEIGFQTFQDVISSIGGLYIDVDRDYGKDNGQFSEMDIRPGYQLLDGQDALLFARYRHDNNLDFGRMARQQRVLAALREQAMGWDLPFKLPGIINTALKGMATNLSANDFLGLARFVVGLNGDRIQQIIITGTLQTIDGMSVVQASPDAIKDAVTKLLTPPTAPTGAAETSQPVLLAQAGTGPALGLLAATTGSTNPSAGSSAVPDLTMWKAAQAKVPFALEAPTFIPKGYAYADTSPRGGGTYDIKVGNGTKPSVRMMYRWGNQDLYLGVSATTWTDAPLASKGTEVKSNGVTYTIVGTSERVDHIWWKRDGVLYFISNTLMYNLGQDDLLRMAESMTDVSSAG